MELKIREFLRDKDYILLAFVFGSFVERRLTEESDFDIAILFKDIPDIAILSEIRDAISDITGRETDIVILNNASPIIKMQVLKKGRLLKKTNDALYNDFFLKAAKEYYDLRMKRREQEKNILKGRLYVRP